ncbi:MAG: FAD-dependent oxidoreductase, partial [Holophagales bacterium]|nr:FAD-dependent oxidoreductase [Holophagales bacterium]
LQQEGLDRALVYLDARVDAARLTHAVAATGSAYGGWVLTRAAAREAVWNAEKSLSGLVIEDLLTGGSHRVEAPLVVNASGAGVDRLRHALGLPGKTVRPSRGTHLIFDRSRLPIEAAVTMLSPDDSRPVFFIPHPEGVLVGTTDLFHDGDVDDPRASREEVDYLLRTVASAFPEDPPGADEVVGVFAGVRPVLDNDSDDPSAASREEAIWYERGLLSVAGGKLTTWRATAEEAVDEALEHLPDRIAQRASSCATAGTALAGLAPEDLAERLERAHELPPRVAKGMARRLGSLAWTACELAGPRELRPLREDLDITAAEVRAHLRFGAVVHLSDLLLRRVRLGMWRPSIARELAPQLCGLACSEMGWNNRRFEQELERYQREAESWAPEGVDDSAKPRAGGAPAERGT